MKLKLLYEWLGHPAGEIIDVKDGYAPSLISRGIGVEVDPFKEETKAVETPEVNKMVNNHQSQNKWRK